MDWPDLNRRIVSCRRCPRLVAHREHIAREKRRQYREWDYWGRPITGFGDPAARLLVVGLAPAAHGGNRTGRIFTGDRSGDWLYDALYVAGFANQATSTDRDDGLVLRDAWITAVARCAPPANRLLPDEIANCQPFLISELNALNRVRVVMVLGQVALNGFLAAWNASGRARVARRPRFGHGLMYRLDERTTMLISFHPSQQNTFTGKLTRHMLRGVFRKAARLVARDAEAGHANQKGE
jgi:uracil-DNA glycosylase family 4